MTKMTPLYRSIWALLVLTGTGCGLLSKAEPMNVRYFTPTLATVSPSSASSAALPLRLGRIESSEHLRERMAFRASAHEIGYHEGLRWTERPDTYFRRALGRELFESGRFAHVVAGVAPTLEAELVAFEELRENNAVRVEARVLVHDGRRVLLERTIRIEESRKGDEPAVITEALSRALQRCVAQIGSEVAEALSALPSRSASAVEPTTPIKCHRTCKPLALQKCTLRVFSRRAHGAVRPELERSNPGGGARLRVGRDHAATTVEQLLPRPKAMSIFPYADATIQQAVETFSELNVGALLVCDGEHLVGILSERDCVRA